MIISDLFILFLIQFTKALYLPWVFHAGRYNHNKTVKKNKTLLFLIYFLLLSPNDDSALSNKRLHSSEKPKDPPQSLSILCSPEGYLLCQFPPYRYIIENYALLLSYAHFISVDMV